jgi:hypothetical protein
MSGQILAIGSTFAISDGSTTVAANAVQTLTMTATGGTAVLGYSGGYGTYAPGKQLTTAIPTSAALTAATVAAALIALPNIGSSTAGLPNVAVAGSAGGPYVVTFQNDLAGKPVPLITVDTTSAMTGGTITPVMTTPGTSAGGVYAAVAALTDMVFPNTKKDVKEITNFDSAGYTKEYIGGFINPGDVAINAMWNGGATQDWRTGLIAKFYAGSSYAMRTNVPNKTPQPGVFTPGLSIGLNGFFTDGTPMGAKQDDVLTVKGSVQISGLPIFSVPVQ